MHYFTFRVTWVMTIGAIGTWTLLASITIKVCFPGDTPSSDTGIDDPEAMAISVGIPR